MDIISWESNIETLRTVFYSVILSEKKRELVRSFASKFPLFLTSHPRI